MIVSRRWLEALLDRPLDARDVSDRLTLHAAAVDAVHHTCGGLADPKGLPVGRWRTGGRADRPAVRLSAGPPGMAGSLTTAPIDAPSSRATPL